MRVTPGLIHCRSLSMALDPLKVLIFGQRPVSAHVFSSVTVLQPHCPAPLLPSSNVASSYAHLLFFPFCLYHLLFMTCPLMPAVLPTLTILLDSACHFLSEGISSLGQIPFLNALQVPEFVSYRTSHSCSNVTFRKSFV